MRRDLFMANLGRGRGLRTPKAPRRIVVHTPRTPPSVRIKVAAPVVPVALPRGHVGWRLATMPGMRQAETRRKAYEKRVAEIRRANEARLVWPTVLTERQRNARLPPWQIEIAPGQRSTGTWVNNEYKESTSRIGGKTIRVRPGSGMAEALGEFRHLGKGRYNYIERIGNKKEVNMTTGVLE